MSIRIFVTTDNHVGYNETDPIQGDDAANSFDEAMKIAQDAGVDFVIQGGDLFHMNKPSKRSLYSVIKTLRRTCLGDKPVEFEVLNHGSLALNDAKDFDYPNYEDSNLNVALPVFAISGNHDDAGGGVGSNMLSPLDVLSMAGLINHFGRVFDSSDIVVKPILIEKAGIRVALYGLASVRDERLYRTFKDNKVKFLRPRTEPDSWYNIIVVHQNHTPHGRTNFLPQEFLPNFVDLVIWGHEHECRIDPLLNTNKGFVVMQPGSTVATSLSDSETKLKHVAVLSIGANKAFSYEKIPLKSVRPFAMRTVSLQEHANINPEDRDARAKVTEWLMGQVLELIEEAKSSWREQHSDDSENWSGSEGNSEPPLPLIRLRVDYTGYDIGNTMRFSNRFVGQAANTTNILSLIKRRETSARLGPKVSTADIPSDGQYVDNIKQVGHLVHQYLMSETLGVLPEREMSEALSRFVEKDEKLALKDSVDDIVKSKVSQLMISVNGDPTVGERSSMDHVTPVADNFPSTKTNNSSHFETSRVNSRMDDSVGLSTEVPEQDIIISDSEEDIDERRRPGPSEAGQGRRHTPVYTRKDGPDMPKTARATRSTRPTFEYQSSQMAPHDYDDDDSDSMFSSS